MAKAKHSRFDCNPGCPVEAAVNIIHGKWKCVLLFHLMQRTMRFNEIQKLLPEVTQRMLTNQLKELEEDGLIIRTVYAQVPVKVEYSVSELGKTLSPILESLKNWGDQNLHLFTGSEDSTK